MTFLANRVVNYVFIYEAWHRRGNVEAGEEIPGSLADDPEADSVLTAVAADGTSSVVESYPLLRDDEGRFTGLGEASVPSNAAGRLTRLLLRSPSEKLVKAAKWWLVRMQANGLITVTQPEKVEIP